MAIERFDKKESREEDSRSIMNLRKGHGITGATLELRLAHLYYLKESQQMLEAALQEEDNNKIAAVAKHLQPFLELFKDVEHPHDSEIWK